MAVKRGNFYRNVEFLRENYPNHTIESFCDHFEYSPVVKGVLTMDECDFKNVFPQDHAKIATNFDNRRDYRTSFEACRDICINFILEDLLVETINTRYKGVNIRLNDGENRNIECTANSNPDFIFTGTSGKELKIELKTDLWKKWKKDNAYHFRHKEKDEYSSNGAVVVLWCPNSGFTTIDFRKEVPGKYGEDVTKGGKMGYWASLEGHVFEDIRMSESCVYLDKLVYRLNKLCNNG